MLSMFVNVRQNSWDLSLSHTMLPYNSSVGRATGLLPNELHIGRVPRLRVIVFERCTFDGHQPLEQGEMYHYELAPSRQRKAFNVSHLEISNSAIYNLMHKRRCARLAIGYGFTTAGRPFDWERVELSTRQFSRPGRHFIGLSQLRSLKLNLHPQHLTNNPLEIRPLSLLGLAMRLSGERP